MRKLKVAVIDILGKSASKKAYARYLRPNNQSIMPQVVAVWCEELGHEVSMAYYNGPDLMAGTIPDDVDLVFINAFSKNALLAYALSNYYRAKGAVTVLGGPHSRSYPDNSVKYFDYAVGFADKALIRDILQDCAQHRPKGQFLSARQQPPSLPGVRERWKFMMLVFEQAKFFKAIPIIGSLGCPYTCSFCIDALVPYQPLDFEPLKEDLRFLLANKRPWTFVAWHDPNFGVRFDDYLGAIEEAIPPRSLTFLAESSLSLLKEDNVKRLAHNGFKVIMPGIESWFDIGDKSKMRAAKGMEKVRRVAEHANMIMSYIPYMQANLIFGLDADEGLEPFALTKRFVDLAPGVVPYFSLLMSYGRNAPDNLRYQREGRVLNIPFHFLDQIHSTNVRPKHYTWPELYDNIADLYGYAFSWRAIAKRFRTHSDRTSRIEQVFRGVAFERNYKYKYYLSVRERLKTDTALLGYLNGETTTVPAFYIEPIKHDLEWLWDWLPEGALSYDPNAYLKTLEGDAEQGPEVRPGMAVA